MGQATRTVHSRAERAHPVDTFPYADEAVHSKTPRGVDAWLVKVDYAGYEGDLCAYVWRDQRRKTRVKWDGAGSAFCEHWEYHY